MIRRYRYQRGSRCWRDGLSVVVGELPAERHYLQLDGTTSDYAFADAVFGGIAGDYTVAIKIGAPISGGYVGGSGWRYFATGGPGISQSAQSSYDRVFRAASVKVQALGTKPSDGTTVYSATASAELVAEKTIIAIRRTLAGGADGAQLRVVNSGGVVHSVDRTATMYKPDHIAIGAALDDALATVPLSFATLKLIGLALCSAVVSDAELIAWLSADTPVGQLSSIDHCWVASDLSGSSIPARVGTVPLTVSGPTEADLVAL